MQGKSRQIAYWIFNYVPKWEAASKEVERLSAAFEGDFGTRIISMDSKGGRFSIGGRNKHLPLPYAVAALPFVGRYASSFAINHLFASPAERLLLPRLAGCPNTVLTISKDHPSLKRFEQNVPYLKRLRYIIVESERHYDLLLQAGIAEEAVKLIYPGSAVKPYRAAVEPFKILFATSPTDKYDFLSRGIYLLVRAARRLPHVRFVLVWRERQLEELLALLAEEAVSNVEVINGHVPDMEPLYHAVHATILPGLTSSSLKPSPHSGLESLAHGKPLLVSQPTSLSGLVQQSRCGVVFEPTIDSLCEAIRRLQGEYDLYQRNCQQVIEECFSLDLFVRKHRYLYESMVGRAAELERRAHA